MVVYDLRCEADHRFEGWFSNAGDFEQQRRDAHLSCPICGSGDVERIPSASHINRGRSRALAQTGKALDGAGEQARALLNRLHEYVDRHFDDVGQNFAEEAKRIHYGERPQRAIRGQATLDEVQSLSEEGIAATPLPPKPIDKEKLN